MNCERFLAAIPDYLEDLLDEDERARWRRHLAQCEGCRRRAVAIEPTLALAAQGVADAAPAEVERCVAAIGAMIRHQRLEGSVRPRRRAGWLAAAAAVVIAAAAGLIWQLGPEPPRAVGTPAVAAGPRLAPEVEVDMEGPEVRVYHLAVDGDTDTAVTLVVNPALEL